MKNQPRYRENSSAAFLDDGKIRILLLALLIFLLFATLAGRLYYLQLYHGEEHRQLIAGQSIRRIRIPGWRGNIYSADGILFAGNRTSYDLVFYPAEMHQGNRRRTIKHMYNAAARIGRTINRREFPSIEDIKHHLWVTPGMPLTIFRNLTAAEIARLSATIRVYGISFTDLPDASPKHQKTKELCAVAVTYMIRHPEIVEDMRRTHLLPMKILQENCDIPRKTLERHRKYIMTATEVCLGDYPVITEYLRHMIKSAEDPGGS